MATFPSSSPKLVMTSKFSLCQCCSTPPKALMIAFEPVVPLWLNGAQRTTKSTFDVVSPVTNQLLWKASSADEDDVRAAVESAEAAFETWRWTKPKERRDIFLRAYHLLEKYRKRSMAYSTTETGAPEVNFGFEYETAVDICFQLAGLVGTPTGFVVDPDALDASAAVIRQPYGVVLGIAPWNAPHTLGIRSCLFPLAAGNTVILKGPELAPATFWHFVSILHEAGLPAGCLNTIYHRPSDAARITEQLISHPAIRKINFTGSSIVGSIIASLSGKHLKPCVMELGGKGPAIVCEDAALDLAAQQCTIGAFTHAGQVCMSTERIIVHAQVAEQFKAALKRSIDQTFSNNSPPLVLVSEKGVVKNHGLVNDALSKGASLVHGSLPASGSETEGKNRMRPVVLEGIKTEMKIYLEESFGPSVSLYTVESDDQALALANRSSFGLSSAVFTEDLRRALKIARRLESGAVHINNMTIHDEVSLPHGGVKESGFGRFNGEDGLKEWLRTKSITWRD
ncbi:aldehyde dehydrogenase [Thozetella sp. PMI_491]|nr:aldehyde dehydrogenase [Thozetella sp. PMI_491]